MGFLRGALKPSAELAIYAVSTNFGTQPACGRNDA
jgi:hypothetical protein